MTSDGTDLRVFNKKTEVEVIVGFRGLHAKAFSMVVVVKWKPFLFGPNVYSDPGSFVESTKATEAKVGS